MHATGRSLWATIPLVGAMALAPPAEAYFIQVGWSHPCSAEPASTLSCIGGGAICYCQGDWDDNDNWDWTYPYLSDQEGQIVHSNTDLYCGGGTNNGDPCDPNSDCPGGVCVPGPDICNGGSNNGNSCSMNADCPSGSCQIETFVQIRLSTETIGELDIRTDSTAAPTDQLEINFVSQSGTNTLTAGTIKLDSTNGPLTVTVVDAVLQSN